MTAPPAGSLRLMLAGDVMTGRGIDQVLPHPGDPALREPVCRSARDYVRLAERRHGPLPAPLPFAHVWGDLPEDLAAARCDLRLVNLETAVTARGAPEPKGINYRMHPDNMPVLAAGGIDGCGLSNNHVLDWGRDGLLDTLDALDRSGIARAGAGRSLAEAEAPAALPLPGGGRVLFLALARTDSGVPPAWAATEDRPGLCLLPREPEAAAALLHRILAPVRRAGDIVVASVHWGGNWGFDVPETQERLAEAMVARAGVDVVMGHSAHHPKRAALVDGRLVLFGCGDLINDYEGLGGHGEYLPDAAVAWLVDLDRREGRLLRLEALVYERRRFRLCRAAPALRDAVAGVIGAGLPGALRRDEPNRILLIPSGPGQGAQS